MKSLVITACALTAVALTACGRKEAEPTPANSAVAAAMPDTNAQPSTDRNMTVPDAGQTGATQPVAAGNAANATQ